MKYTAHATVNNSTDIIRKGTNKRKLRSQIISEVKANIFAGRTNVSMWSVTDEDGREVYKGYVRG
jgi:hypothetical protein